MTKQYDNKAVYRVKLECNYLVTICFDHWTNSGNAVYDAEIINLDKFGDTYTAAHHYRFTGHCNGEYHEARWIVRYHEHKDRQMRGGAGNEN